MEIFDICDENGIPTGKTISRKEAHRLGVCHRTAHVWVVRERSGRYEVLLQKRSRNKDSFPGCLDTSSAGHITAGDEPLPSAMREFFEELGIKALPEELAFAGTFHIQYEENFHGEMFRDNEVAFVYVYSQPVELSELILQEEELEGAGWYDLQDTYVQLKAQNPLYCVPMEGLLTLAGKLKVTLCP